MTKINYKPSEKIVDNYCNLLEENKKLKSEIKDIITIHNLLKKSDDFYYASYMKDHVEGIKKRMKREKCLLK